MAFREQLEWALAWDLPVAIHSRESLDWNIRHRVGVCRQRGIRGVFHCFTGTKEQARRIIDIGMYLGVGGILSFKNSDVREVLAEIDPGFLLLETDSPYLAPVPHRGKRNEPAYIVETAKVLSEVLKIRSGIVGRNANG